MCVCVYVCMALGSYLCVYVCMYVWLPMCVCVCVYVCMVDVTVVQWVGYRAHDHNRKVVSSSPLVDLV